MKSKDNDIMQLMLNGGQHYRDNTNTKNEASQPGATSIRKEAMLTMPVRLWKPLRSQSITHHLQGIHFNSCLFEFKISNNIKTFIISNK